MNATGKKLTIQIFGTKQCRDTQKALRFFRERRVETQFRDMALRPPSPGELDDMAAAAGGAAALLNTESPAAKERGLAYLDYDPRDELLADPRLYTTPLVRAGKGRAAIGYDPAAWQDFAG